MWRMRYGVLSALGICMTLVNGKDEITDTDVLLDILGKQRDIYFKEQSTRLANSTILGTTELRTRFMEYHSEKGALSAAILRDPDILV